MNRSLAVTIVALFVVVPCQAGIFSHSCPHCGCNELNRVCRTVPEVKKITETKFVVECEDYAVLGKTRCETRVIPDCNSSTGQRCETVQVPTCDRIVTRKRLKKVTTTIEKPSFKCVVDIVCSQCGSQCGTAPCVP